MSDSRWQGVDIYRAALERRAISRAPMQRHVGSGGEKVSQVIRSRSCMGRKPEKRLLHERRRLPGAVLLLTPEIPRRQAILFGTDQRYEAIQSAPVAFPPTGE